MHICGTLWKVASWAPPTPAVAEMIRTGAGLLLETREAIFAEVDGAILADQASPLVTDPAIAAAIRRNTHANLVHWAEANLVAPGAPVPPNVGRGALTLARDLVRRGLDQTALHTYRVGQNVGWQRWMSLAFQLTSDPAELRELLDVSARSIFTFVDATLAELGVQIERERDELLRGTHAQRLEVVNLLLEGAPISEQRAATRLGYSLRGTHTAAIVWSDAAEIDPARLEQAAEAVGRAAGTRPLTILASASASWVWVAGAPRAESSSLGDAIEQIPDVRIALGSPAAGAPGFRRSHLDALATQRLMHRGPPERRVASYEEVQLVSLVTQDEERADQFVATTLGALAEAPAELRETARVYMREGYNAARTARVMFTHRNTILARLDRVDALLPAPLGERGLQVALALEVLRWR